jgi:hypothetical protein
LAGGSDPADPARLTLTSFPMEASSPAFTTTGVTPSPVTELSPFRTSSFVTSPSAVSQ